MILEGFVRKWLTQIEKSPEKLIIIDVMEEFSDITTKEMTTIIYGEDMSHKIVEVDCFVAQEGSPFKFIRKRLTFGCALTEIIRQVY